ncbi:MAG TPA: Dabb family protein [Gemmata sp.]
MLRLFVAAALVACCGTLVSAEDKKPPMIGHMVYFKLKDSTPENRKKLVTACEKYLSEHPGTVFFSAGEIGDDFKRDVNDRDWDVALHLVFVDKAAHDKYAVDKEHLKFIEENKANWAKVRVFDSELRGYKTGKK